MINKKLAEELHLSPDTIQTIEALHEHRTNICKTMSINTDRDILRAYDEQLDEIEERLQILWGFGIDKNYVMFWNRPGCLCPKMDNNDRYPHGYYVISNDCPLHGVKEG